MLLSGRVVVVAGYGWCGRGVAMRARGLGAIVIVTEIDPTKAIEAVMDGFQVMPMEQAGPIADLIVTLTGNKHVVDVRHFETMKDGCVVCNSGHFNVEINIPGLEAMASAKRTVRPFVEEYSLSGGRRIYILAEGRLINLAAAEGHPASVMDMSFANQSLCAEYMALNAKSLAKEVYRVPIEIDQNVAAIKLQSMGIAIDSLTAEQEHYLGSWQEGT
jgi:adenosylhomocysteinase